MISKNDKNIEFRNRNRKKGRKIKFKIKSNHYKQKKLRDNNKRDNRNKN